MADFARGSSAADIQIGTEAQDVPNSTSDLTLAKGGDLMARSSTDA
jgi:hypothetical protein